MMMTAGGWERLEIRDDHLRCGAESNAGTQADCPIRNNYKVNTGL